MEQLETGDYQRDNLLLEIIMDNLFYRIPFLLLGFGNNTGFWIQETSMILEVFLKPLYSVWQYQLII